MKNITELKEEITDIKHRIQHEGMKPAAERKLRKRIPFLNMCISYMETEPKESFLKEEVKKVETKINLRMNAFALDDYKSDQIDKPTLRKLKKAHEKKYEVPHLRNQVQALRFLLK